MNPLTRRRAERRRLADWAARAHRVAQSEADGAAGADGVEETNPAPVRRLPFELLEPAAAVALVQPPSNGNGHGNGHAVEQPAEPVGSPEPVEAPLPVEPAVATATTTQESLTPAAEGPVEVSQPPEAVEPPQAAQPHAADVLQAARKALDGRDLSLAEQLYREVLGEDPRDIRARNGLALVLDARGEHQAALEQLDRCRAQDEGNTKVLVNRCGVLGTLGRYADAERGLRAVLEREPGNAAAQFQLGLVASRRGRWCDAVPYLRQATALDSNLAGAHLYLGEALNHMDDLPGALQAYQRAVELSPHNPKAWYGMGIVLDRMNRPDDAAQRYRRSRELQGK